MSSSAAPTDAPISTLSGTAPHASWGRLTTHVLDTVQGRPAAGMALSLYVRVPSPDGCADGRWQLLRHVVTNDDGRIDGPLLQGEDVKRGHYRLVFEVDTYFRAQGVPLPDMPFLTQVPLDFGIDDEGAHYHVPLLLSPFGFSTYRGN